MGFQLLNGAGYHLTYYYHLTYNAIYNLLAFDFVRAE